MNLSTEWNNRIIIWLEELKKHFYTELRSVEFDGFTTMDFLDMSTATSMAFSPMAVGTKWGKKWEYGWFRTHITIPSAAAGKRIVLHPEIGGEMLIWINGQIAGSKDLKHDEITLTPCAKPGDSFSIVIESYSGHGPRLENGGPYPPERIPVPDAPEKQVQVGHSSFGIWNEDAYQLWLDAFTLYKLLLEINPKSLRAQKIASGLKEFTRIADFEQPIEQRIESFIAARKALKPLLDCTNGSTAPLLTIFGQSHLDLAWKWPFEETKRKCARTLSTQLALMDEYPEYRFLLCEPPILETVKEYYPSLYKRVKNKIQNGQIIPEGGMWVECDTNIPSGESLIRQFVWGKRWFKEECGQDTKMAWMPDTFGFSGAIPQIMKGCGIPYFATQKLLRPNPETDPFPYNIFLWEGIDGSQILSHIFKKNNSQYDPSLLIQRWEEDRIQQEDIDSFLFPFGFGDGGGGATRDMLEVVRRTEDLEGAPRTKTQSPIAFFENIEENTSTKNRYVGELYLPWHRGTYTSQAKTKAGCRKSEIILREAEFWCSIASSQNIMEYPAARLHTLWKKLLFNQFHDILAGASITRVHEEAERDFSHIIKEGNQIYNEALSSMVLTDRKDGMVIFNSLSWDRNALVQLPKGMVGALDSNGSLLPSQEVEGKVYVQAILPPCGWTTIYPQSLGDYKDEICKATDTYSSPLLLENEYLRVTFNSAGQILSILDKETGMELTKGLCNNFKMYKDVNTNYDAWEIGSMYEELPVSLSTDVNMEVFTHGPLVTGIRINRTLHQSNMIQEITLEQGSHRIDFKTKIDWQERHKLLKVEFPLNLHTDEAIHEIQFGYLKRPTHQSRVHDADRYEVCCHRYTALAEAERGCAILNDSKYGVSCDRNNIQLTLLKSPVIPDMYADQGIQEFTYSFYAYNGSFSNSGVVQNGYELNIPVLTTRGQTDECSLFSLSHNNIILETVKIADDSSGDIILRLYESQKTAVRCLLRTTLTVDSVYETDMLEEKKTSLQIHSNTIELTFRPFEIKTLRLKTIKIDN